MELKEFIVQTMKGITEGMNDCEKEGISIKKDHYNDVVFDVAITVGNTAEGSAGGKLMIAGIGVGSEVRTQFESTAVSRINFHITHNPK